MLHNPPLGNILFKTHYRNDSPNAFLKTIKSMLMYLHSGIASVQQLHRHWRSLDDTAYLTLKRRVPLKVPHLKPELLDVFLLFCTIPEQAYGI